MASSAKELKERLRKKPLPIVVTIPGTDLTIECCRPNLVHMVMSGLMTWPALERVRALSAELEPPAGAAIIDNRPLPTVVDKAQAIGPMIDEWVCAAAVSPRVVMSEYDEKEDSIWVENIPYEGRQAIFNATFVVTPTAGADFRHEESGSAPPGQSGEAVRDEALVAVGADGTDGGAGS